MINELIKDAADFLLEFCGEDAILRSGESEEKVRVAPLTLLEQERTDSNGSTERSTRTLLLRLESAVRFLPGRSRLALEKEACLIVSASALPGGGLYRVETEVIS